MSEYTQRRDDLLRRPDAKFGFVIYRCTYSNDSDWAKFMQYLDAHTRRKLEERGLGELYSRLDWAVQEDPQLEDASEEEVRRRFRTWVEEAHESDVCFPRSRVCVMVQDVHVDWVVNRHALPVDHQESREVHTITLISTRDEDPESDEEEEFDTFDPTKPLEEQMYADSDDEEREPHPPRDRVSSVEVGLSYLIPETWVILDGPGWHSVVAERRMIRERGW